MQAPTLPDLFERAALVVYDLAFDIERVRVERDVPVMAVGDTPDQLLGDWLEQVVKHARRHNLVVCTVAVDRLEVGGVQGAIGGFAYDGAPPRRFVPSGAELAGSVVEVPEGHWVRLTVHG